MAMTSRSAVRRCAAGPIGVRSSPVAPRVMAAPVRRSVKVAFQSNTSVLSIIQEDHRKVEKAYADYKKPGTSDERKQEIAFEIIKDLSVHAACEEMVWYPEIRKKLGEQEANNAIHEHAELKKALSDLDGMQLKSDVAKYDAQVDKVMKLVVQHVKEDEEPKLIPAFAKAVGDDSAYLEDLGRKFEAARAGAPTRPHPLAPSTPPLNLAANPLTAPLDKARDAGRNATGL